MRRVIYKAPKLIGKQWELVDQSEAKFHQFSVDYEEFETGPGNYAAAIIELPTGEVKVIRADLIRFIDNVLPEAKNV